MYVYHIYLFGTYFALLADERQTSRFCSHKGETCDEHCEAHNNSKLFD